MQNRSIDSLRKTGKISFENIETVKEVEYDLAEIQYMNEEPELNNDRILDVIKKLPEKARNVFTLYFLEGYDCGEISDILSISCGTSRSQSLKSQVEICS